LAHVGREASLSGLLLAKKAEVNVKDWDGDTSLGEAIERNNTEIIELLLRHGAKN
jgi:ankyrin repeat protein